MASSNQHTPCPTKEYFARQFGDRYGFQERDAQAMFHAYAADSHRFDRLAHMLTGFKSEH